MPREPPRDDTESWEMLNYHRTELYRRGMQRYQQCMALNPDDAQINNLGALQQSVENVNNLWIDAGWTTNDDGRSAGEWAAAHVVLDILGVFTGNMEQIYRELYTAAAAAVGDGGGASFKVTLRPRQRKFTFRT